MVKLESHSDLWANASLSTKRMNFEVADLKWARFYNLWIREKMAAILGLKCSFEKKGDF